VGFLVRCWRGTGSCCPSCLRRNIAINGGVGVVSLNPTASGDPCLSAASPEALALDRDFRFRFRFRLGVASPFSGPSTLNQNPSIFSPTVSVTARSSDSDASRLTPAPLRAAYLAPGVGLTASENAPRHTPAETTWAAGVTRFRRLPLQFPPGSAHDASGSIPPVRARPRPSAGGG